VIARKSENIVLNRVRNSATNVTLRVILQTIVLSKTKDAKRVVRTLGENVMKNLEI